MKFKHILLNITLCCIAIVSVSCDGTDTIAENDILNNLDEVGTSIEETEDNDVITHTILENSVNLSLPTNIVFSGITGTENKSDTAAQYTYSKTGETLFELNFENVRGEQLTRALRQTLGNPSPLGTRLRELLLRAEAIFTEEEIIEIINILNPSGASVISDSEDPTKLNTIGVISIKHRVTSNTRDKLAGTMRGVFQVDITSFEVNFRAPTSQELEEFRLLTSSHKIPFVTTNSKNNERQAAGVWVLSLANREGRPR